MRFNIFNFFILAALGVVLGGCSTTTLSPKSSFTVPSIINDRKIMSQMTDKATEMMDSDSVVSMQTLITKLKTEPKIKLASSCAAS